jgi:hypothetical protein
LSSGERRKGLILIRSHAHHPVAADAVDARMRAPRIRRHASSSYSSSSRRGVPQQKQNMKDTWNMFAVNDRAVFCVDAWRCDGESYGY